MPVFVLCCFAFNLLCNSAWSAAVTEVGICDKRGIYGQREISSPVVKRSLALIRSDGITNNIQNHVNLITAEDDFKKEIKKKSTRELD